MSNKDVFEIEGDLGEFDYGGVTLNTVELLVQRIAIDIVAPEVKNNIDRITGETEISIENNRVGFFHRGTLAPTWEVSTDVEHNIMLEFGNGGINSYMRRAARSRKVKALIREATKRFFNFDLKAQVRNIKKSKGWRAVPARRK